MLIIKDNIIELRLHEGFKKSLNNETFLNNSSAQS